MWNCNSIVSRCALFACLLVCTACSTIVSTTTSGIPIHHIAAGRSVSFQQHFLGTHFFNPPRYLKLMELIPHDKNSPELVAFMKAFCTRVLGKGVVVCKDTPNFIANRVISIVGSYSMAYALEHGYTVEEVDAITGPAIGRPRTATFRLIDQIGFDIWDQVARNLYDAIPHDLHREVLLRMKLSALSAAMIDRGWLGNKADQGFYKENLVEGERQLWTLNLETFQYQPSRRPQFDSAVRAMRVSNPAEKVATIAYAEDRAGRMAWHILSRTAVYAASCIPEFSDDILSVDNACKWGFNWELGPFEIWDALGVAESILRLRTEGLAIPGWVMEMLVSGFKTFYQTDTYSGLVTGYYDWKSKEYRPLPHDPDLISIPELKAAGKELEANESASLLDMGDNVLLLEFHSKANTLGVGVLSMFEIAIGMLKKGKWIGAVIGNQGKHFSAGAYLNAFMAAIDVGRFDLIDRTIRQIQNIVQKLRYSSKPWVAAPFGMVLGGGCELVMAASRAVAALETSMGLVETRVGLVPAAGGCKEMVRRLVTPVAKNRRADALPSLQMVLEQIGTSRISSSAAEAQAMGFLTQGDRIIANRDYLLAEAKQTVLDMVRDGYWPPAPEEVYAAGRDALAALKMSLQQMRWAGYASEHDVLIGQQLAHMLCGGELSAPTWINERYLLDLEREALVALCREPRTQERIRHMLETKRALRT